MQYIPRRQQKEYVLYIGIQNTFYISQGPYTGCSVEVVTN